MATDPHILKKYPLSDIILESQGLVKLATAALPGDSQKHVPSDAQLYPQSSIRCLRCKKTYTCTGTWSQDLQCETCKWRFTSPCELQCHYDHVHVHERRCPMCDYTCDIGGMNQMDVHFRTAHRKAEIFHCYLCDTTLNTRKTLQGHLLRHNHPTGAFSCEHCGMKFEAEKRLNVHKVQSHFLLLGFPEPGTVTSQVAPPGTSIVYVCPLCDAKFKYEGSLNVHTQTQHAREGDGKKSARPQGVTSVSKDADHSYSQSALATARRKQGTGTGDVTQPETRDSLGRIRSIDDSTITIETRRFPPQAGIERRFAPDGVRLPEEESETQLIELPVTFNPDGTMSMAVPTGNTQEVIVYVDDGNLATHQEVSSAALATEAVDIETTGTVLATTEENGGDGVVEGESYYITESGECVSEGGVVIQDTFGGDGADGGDGVGDDGGMSVGEQVFIEVVYKQEDAQE